MRIVLCYLAEPRHTKQIEQVASGMDVIDAGQDSVARQILDADIFCGHPKVPMPWDAVVAKGRLKWIQGSSSGIDHCLVPSVVNSEIVVTNASGVFANQVAEHTLAILCGLLRSLPTFIRAAQQKDFTRRPTRDLHGATVGIVGFGGNGQRIAELLAPFHTRILATDMFPDAQPLPSHVEAVWAADRLDELLPLVDVLILCVPLTDATQGMIDRGALARMKPGAILVNVARGQVVVERDLIDVLRSGHLGGAALDVAEIEPLPKNSPLWEMPDVVITPHVGAQSATRFDDVTNFFCENLERYLAGQPLKNLVDKKIGFPVKDG